MSTPMTSKAPVDKIKEILRKHHVIIPEAVDKDTFITHVPFSAIEELIDYLLMDTGSHIDADLRFIEKYPMFGISGWIYDNKFTYSEIEELPKRNPPKAAVKAFVNYAMRTHADELDIYPCRMWWD